MKLKFFLKNKKKNYTLKKEVDGMETKEAHYKFKKAPVFTRTKKELST